MFKSQLVDAMTSLLETQFRTRPSESEFELAYQIRVTIDRIRFAIKTLERLAQSDPVQDVGLQLLDALDRLESTDRLFQVRCRLRPHYGNRESGPEVSQVSKENANGESRS